MYDKQYPLPYLLKDRLNEAMDKAIANYRYDYKNIPHFKRNRKLALEDVVKLLLSMQGGSLKKELHEAGVKASPSAFSQQRQKIPWTVFEDTLEQFNILCKDNDRKKYKGYRLLAVDGTTVNMARNPKAESFVQYSENDRGFNQLHITPLYDVLNNTYLHSIVQPEPCKDEVGALGSMLAWHWFEFTEPTLIVADRGFESYNAFAYFMEPEYQNVEFLVRVKQGRGAMREIGKLPMRELDTDVAFTVTTTQTNVDKQNNYIFLQTRKHENKIYSDKTRAGRWEHPSPFPMKFRVVRFRLDTGEYETLATSLPRSIRPEEIKELYHSRWTVETAFRQLKYGLGLVNLHGKSDECVRQEVYASMILNNFCSRIVNEVIIQQKENNIYEHKVNMSMALHLCRSFFRDENADAEQLMNDIARYTEPIRPGRSDTRNVKAQTFRGFIYRVSA